MVKKGPPSSIRITRAPTCEHRPKSGRTRSLIEEQAMPWDYVIPLVITALVVGVMIVLARRGVGT
jgi:hypothetical protein